MMPQKGDLVVKGKSGLCSFASKWKFSIISLDWTRVKIIGMQHPVFRIFLGPFCLTRCFFLEFCGRVCLRLRDEFLQVQILTSFYVKKEQRTSFSGVS